MSARASLMAEIARPQAQNLWAAKGGGFMNRWFRAYDDAIDDPKLQRLSGDAFKSLFNLWCLASQNGGVLPAIDDIAFKLRMKPAKVETLLKTLHDAKLLDTDDTGTRPHNWDSRQFKSDGSTERVKRFRNVSSAVSEAKLKRFRNVSSAVSETGPETDTDSETETERKKRKKDAASAAADAAHSFENGTSPNGTGPPTPETELFVRGKAVLGKNAGGLIRNLLKAKGGNVPLARAAIETASTKQDPREYIGAVTRGDPDLTAKEELRRRGDAW